MLIVTRGTILFVNNEEVIVTRILKHGVEISNGMVLDFADVESLFLA